ncbi:uncharacterized protein LOC120349704 [Nilaparvata lugens]|uniref:uncharacterized protein LOC120349704 n=1 Tax=Nilaparvata lugens TaxID=108931 RepID=UPI00193CBB85|nr:uncharacterized protein LOC120349704 [Nilaparvata lugens]
MRMWLFGPSSLLWLLALQLIISAPARAGLTITRHLKGDLFSPPECGEATCAGVSAGTAGAGLGLSDGWGDATNARCTCQCRDALPVFRDDLRVCVDDIQATIDLLTMEFGVNVWNTIFDFAALLRLFWK